MAATLTLVHNKPIRRWPTAVPEGDFSRPETFQETFDLADYGTQILIHACNHLSGDNTGAWELIRQKQSDLIECLGWMTRVQTVGVR